MTWTQEDIKKINDISKKEPYLVYQGKRKDNKNTSVQLGDLVREGLSAGAKEGTYDFAINGGDIGEISLKNSVPVGAVIKAVYTEVVSAVTSGGAPEVDIKVGSDVLASIADATALSGIELQTTTLTRTSAEESLVFEIKAAAITAGEVNVIVEYINP